MPDRMSRVEVMIELDAGPGGQDDELDRSTQQLRRRLRELDVLDVRRLADSSPERGPNGAGDTANDTAGGEQVHGAALVVQLAPVLPALLDVVQTVRAWLSQYPDRVVSLAIDGDRLEVAGGSLEEQRERIRSWTERHSPTEL